MQRGATTVLRHRGEAGEAALQEASERRAQLELVLGLGLRRLRDRRLLRGDAVVAGIAVAHGPRQLVTPARRVFFGS